MITLSRVLLTAPIIIFVALWVRAELAMDGRQQEDSKGMYGGLACLALLSFLPAEGIHPLFGVALGGLFLLVASLELLLVIPDDWGKKPSE